MPWISFEKKFPSQFTIFNVDCLKTDDQLRLDDKTVEYLLWDNVAREVYTHHPDPGPDQSEKKHSAFMQWQEKEAHVEVSEEILNHPDPEAVLKAIVPFPVVNYHMRITPDCVRQCASQLAVFPRLTLELCGLGTETGTTLDLSYLGAILTDVYVCNLSIKNLMMVSMFALRSLTLIECNQLETVDICGVSALRKLDISNCALLTRFNVGACIDVEEVHIHDTALIDSLPDSVSEYTIKNLRKLRVLHFSENQKVKQLNCLNLPKLQKIEVQCCPELSNITHSRLDTVKEIDLLECPSLGDLDVSNYLLLEKLHTSFAPLVRKIFAPKNCTVLHGGFYKSKAAFVSPSDGLTVVKV